MTQIDVTNTDQFYWEEILAKSDLSADKEIPQAIEITVEEFKELTNLDLLPEEDYEREDDPVIIFNGITKDTDRLNADHSGLWETNDELRTKVDGDDTFFKGHRIIKQRRGNRECPDWAYSTVKLRALLLKSFPKLLTNKKQRASAGRWARVIQMYFKSQMTHGQIASELHVGLNTVLMLIRAIKLAARGVRTDTGKPRGVRGRPRSSKEIMT